MNNGKNATELLICPMLSVPDVELEPRSAHALSSAGERTTGVAATPLSRLLRDTTMSDSKGLRDWALLVERLPPVDPSAEQADADVEDGRDDAEDHERREDTRGVELRGGVVDEVSEAAVGGDQLADHGTEQGVRDRDLETGQQSGHRGRKHDEAQDVSPPTAHQPHRVDKTTVDVSDRGGR